MAYIIVIVKTGNVCNSLLALFRVKGAFEFEIDLGSLSDCEGLRAPEGAFVFIFLDDGHALETDGLFTWPVAFVWFFCDVVADHTFV